MALNNLIKKLENFSFFETFKHASTYFSGTILVHLLGIFSLPVFTSYLTPDEYGIINVFTSYVTTAAVLQTLNIHWATQRYYFEEDKDDFDAFLGTLLITATILFVFVGGFIITFSNEIGALINIPVHLVKWIILMSYLIVIFSVFSQIMIATKQSKKFATVQVVWQYAKFGCTIIGLIYFTDVFYWNGSEKESYTFMGKIIAEAIVTGILIFYAFYEINKHLSFRNVSFSYVRYALIYSIPLIPFALSNYILNFFDQWIINSTIGHEEAGYYAFAYKIAVIYMGLGTALLNGANPSYYEYMNKKEHKKVWQQVDSMTKLLILGGGFLILFAVDAGTMLSSNDVFLEALPIAPIIIGSYVFWGISSFVNRGIYFVKKNSYLAVIVLISGIVNILLNAYFLKHYGYQAAAYTTLASYVLMMLLSIGITTYILKLPPLPLGRILKYIVLLGTTVSLNYIIGEPNRGMHFGWIAFKSALFGVLSISLFYDKIGLLLFNKSLDKEDVLDTPKEE